MKITVTSQKPYINSETLEFEELDNGENMNSLKGAGIQSATAISDKGAEVLVTGFCGPNAAKTLKAAGIKMENTESHSGYMVLDIRHGNEAQPFVKKFGDIWKPFPYEEIRRLL